MEAAQEGGVIPLPEHPRPDLMREEWVNLNGTWQFAFDQKDEGGTRNWGLGNPEDFGERILVPFSWGSPLSGVGNEADIAWYRRQVKVPPTWEGKRVFLVVGASDWRTTAWFEGKEVGTYQGGYTPFEFELTSDVRFGEEQTLVLRVDDSPHPFKLEGKQGYGAARGIWQTPYLEARGTLPIKGVRFVPDIDASKVNARVTLLEPCQKEAALTISFASGAYTPVTVPIQLGQKTVELEISMPDARLWSLEDPYLHEVSLSVSGADLVTDNLDTYFGMRKISVVRLPGSGYPYIAINDQPVYLRMALDQAYHPEGYYTFPSDEFMRDEIVRSLKIGLNGMRIHVKIGIPRKIYWADRLGMLIMEDIPNSWGEPTPEMKGEVDVALLGMIERDFNHPSIFSWVIFNETWGLDTKASDGKKSYTKETQRWVESMVQLTRELDPTRLVEDNSPHREDHTITDINSWHSYLPGWEWETKLKEISDNTYPGSEWNFAEGYKQGDQPLFNSECGNVWGYSGSTGDVDWSWDYHRMMNAFRRYPKISGWLYTEHHDVINEWNGYYRYDRSEKETGLGELVSGMTLNDLHSAMYLSPGIDLSLSVQPGTSVEVPLTLSTQGLGGVTDRQIRINADLSGWDDLGRPISLGQVSRTVTVEPWTTSELSPFKFDMPNSPALVIAKFILEDAGGRVHHRNFTTFVVEADSNPQNEERMIDGRSVQLLRIPPDKASASEWTLKSWEVLDGLKVNGAGSGFFEYRIVWPEGLEAGAVSEAVFLAELGAKVLFGKDRAGDTKIGGDYMRGQGAHDPSLNRNAYPMTDTSLNPSRVRVRVNGIAAGDAYLADDPADHRGILSWHAQLKDRFLREAGSYGYLTSLNIPPEALTRAASQGELVIRLEVDPAYAGGLAVYGKKFGRYPLDPTV
ncbi:MAG: glycoside hydrolase family 2, partial [Acidobacteriota bacterium]